MMLSRLPRLAPLLILLATPLFAQNGDKAGEVQHHRLTMQVNGAFQGCPEIEGGKTLEVKVHVEDSGAFTTPWDVSQRYARSELRPMQERACTENNANYFKVEIDPTPEARKPDF